ncbi:hypothetical protein AVEN_89698-1 [Araneus ventricosus]|uniref:TD and POZ domain-containing protein 4 n=1 Tax=Araneus ventricosus TaxID=182803 RepID=A0A4Y2T2L8_ARAVE|nr:hypothetical protein AVEN_89698-1 [Araneus ventricosus]
MSSKEESGKKCFTFIWKLENASFCWPKERAPLESPPFEVEEMGETKWKLRLLPKCGKKQDYVGLVLHRLFDSGGSDKVEIDFELTFLAPDGTDLESVRKMKQTFSKKHFVGSFSFVKNDDVFRRKKSTYLPRDTLTVCGRIWKSGGEFSEHAQCVARTVIGIEKILYTLNVENFSTVAPYRRDSHDIQSKNKKTLLSLDIILNRDEEIHFVINRKNREIKYSMLEIFLLNASKNDTVKCFQGEFWFHDHNQRREFKIFHTKKMLMEKKSGFLSNDILSLRCKCALSFGIVREEIERQFPHYSAFEDSELNNRFSDKKDVLSVSKSVLKESLKQILNPENTSFLYRYNLIESLQSTVNSSSFSDLELRTRLKTYPAHKFILGARSPAMFSKKKIDDCINMEGFEDGAVFRMLQYIYSGEIKELNWVSASELYGAAEKFQILALKDECSSYMKKHLHRSNVCEALILADLHRDGDLKECVQNFISRHRKDIMSSKEWEQLMERNPKLAANTMCKMFKS